MDNLSNVLLCTYFTYSMYAMMPIFQVSELRATSPDITSGAQYIEWGPTYLALREAGFNTQPAFHTSIFNRESFLS